MIEELRIEDLGVIGRAHVRLRPGLTVLTGETGAGKTMVLTALALLLGAKADPATVRAGAAAAVVEGRVRLDGRQRALGLVEEAGGALDDDGTLLLLRTVTAESADGPGRSRAHLGGRSVPQSVLADLAEDLVTVHGQADQLRLRTPARQREALDAFAGAEHLAALARHRDAWAARAQAAAELSELVDRAADRAREAELLRVGLAEVERIAPQPGEDAALAEESRRLSHAEDLRAAATGAHAALVGDDAVDDAPSAAALVDTARRLLEHAGSNDPALAELARRLAEAGYLLGDVAGDLAGYLEDLQADPLRLDAVERRRAELATLTRTHGGDVAQVLAWADEAGLRLLELDGGQDRVDALQARLDALDGELAGLQAALTAARTEAAARLSQVVSAELAGLAMAGARLDVAVEPAEPGAAGADRVEMLLVPHAGAPARPLGKGASGGELSRVMLALEVALATTGGTGRAVDGPSTFVFDEVDAGVGGRSAIEVGRRLAALARGSQVLVVTHLAQVAAFADTHLVVTKSSADALVTAADLVEVTGPERVRELARMLAGQEDSASAQAHAAELLELSGAGR